MAGSVLIAGVVGAATVVSLPGRDEGTSVSAAGAPPQPDAAPQLPPEKQAGEAQEELRRQRAEQAPRAPKGQGQRPGSCAAPGVQPVIEPASDAVPGVRMTPVSQTRIVYGKSVYLVWSGLDTAEDTPSSQGTIVVIESPRDACVEGNPSSTRRIFAMPTRHGAITLLKVDAALLSLRSEDGTAGTFNLETNMYR